MHWAPPLLTSPLLVLDLSLSQYAFPFSRLKYAFCSPSPYLDLPLTVTVSLLPTLIAVSIYSQIHPRYFFCLEDCCRMLDPGLSVFRLVLFSLFLLT